MLKKQKGSVEGWFGLIYLLLWAACAIGWGVNIYKLCVADFEAPYKTEIIRGIGIPVFFVGGIVGYMDIGEENESKD